MSSKSAAVYETSTETLFVGRQDAMQRQTLRPPLASNLRRALGGPALTDDAVRDRLLPMSDAELAAVLTPRERAALEYGYRERVTDVELPHVRELPRALPPLLAAAAVRAKEAGFDGVEVHGAHGYLICQFLGEQTNRRSDRWGGDLTGRSRLLFEIVRSIRARTRPDFIVWVRISPQLHAMGVSLADSLALAPRIAAAGVDALHISCWDAFAGAPDEPGDPRTLTRRFRAVLPEGYPLVSTGGVWTEADAAFVLDEGADLVGVARVGIGHPDWPSHLGEGDYEPARPPFEPAHLRGAGLSEAFVDYMRRWSGFVTDGRG